MGVCSRESENASWLFAKPRPTEHYCSSSTQHPPWDTWDAQQVLVGVHNQIPLSTGK